MKNKTALFALMTGLSGAMLFTGCSSNKGGETTCHDFLSQAQDKQNSIVTKMYNDKHGKDPNGIKLVALRTEATAYCSITANEKTNISNVPLS